MNRVYDDQLSHQQKLEMIASIEFWQKKRWSRLHYFRSCVFLPMAARHVLIKTEINILRSQSKRLENLKKSLWSQS